jgi:ATP-dependent DNA ligase
LTRHPREGLHEIKYDGYRMHARIDGGSAVRQAERDQEVVSGKCELPRLRERLFGRRSTATEGFCDG